MYTDEQIIKALEAKAPHDEVAREALRVINHKDNLLYAARFAFLEIYKQLQKSKNDLERYGRRIREQKEDILDLLAKLDGAIAGQETLQKALAERSKT